MKTVTSKTGHNYAQSDQALLMYSRVNIPPPFSIISACIWLLVKFPVLLGPYSHMFNKIEYFPFAASGTLVIAECHPFTRENGTVQVFGFVIDSELNKSLFIAALLKLLFERGQEDTKTVAPGESGVPPKEKGRRDMEPYTNINVKKTKL